jgi:hypothetical protein
MGSSSTVTICTQLEKLLQKAHGTRREGQCIQFALTTAAITGFERQLSAECCLWAAPDRLRHGSALPQILNRQQTVENPPWCHQAIPADSMTKDGFPAIC